MINRRNYEIKFNGKLWRKKKQVIGMGYLMWIKKENFRKKQDDLLKLFML